MPGLAATPGFVACVSFKYSGRRLSRVPSRVMLPDDIAFKTARHRIAIHANVERVERE
jgi:hypothetical protein